MRKGYLKIWIILICTVLLISFIIINKTPDKTSYKNEPTLKEEKQQDNILKEEDIEKGLLILVNKENPIDRDYKPDDLKSVRYYASDRSPACRYLREEASDQFHEMVEAAEKEGHTIVMTTAFRSFDFQKILWDNYVEREGEEAASKYSARPGTSEHQTGLAVDITSPGVDYKLSNTFDQTEEGAWIARNAHKFGFILRFPKGKEEITGYQFEPWHLRYVGEYSATEIYRKGLTLEEYLQ